MAFIASFDGLLALLTDGLGVEKDSLKMICRLPASVRSYIRSGVAIASVTQCVEELLLNSVDAGATCIAVRVDLTCFYIQVVDNGVGITPDQLNLVGERYSTSKCQCIKDLESPNYFGYRGEALASIRNVAFVLEITSRSKLSGQTNFRLFKEGKALQVSKSEIHRPSIGTTVAVHNLFYNMPVRQKSINVNLELERIIQRVQALALLKPSLSISLRNNITGSVLLQTHKTNSPAITFGFLFGQSKSQSLVAVKHNAGHFRICGFVSKDAHYRNDLQFIFVNGRLILKTPVHKILSKLLGKSLIVKRKITSNDFGINEKTASTCSPTKQADRYPMFMLDIICPLTEYDITFDPRKTIVEFADWSTLVSSLTEMVQEFLQKENLSISLDNMIRSPCGESNQLNDAEPMEINKLPLSCNTVGDFCTEMSDEIERKMFLELSSRGLKSQLVTRYSHDETSKTDEQENNSRKDIKRTLCVSEDTAHGGVSGKPTELLTLELPASFIDSSQQEEVRADCIILNGEMPLSDAKTLANCKTPVKHLLGKTTSVTDNESPLSAIASGCLFSANDNLHGSMNSRTTKNLMDPMSAFDEELTGTAKKDATIQSKDGNFLTRDDRYNMRSQTNTCPSVLSHFRSGKWKASQNSKIPSLLSSLKSSQLTRSSLAKFSSLSQFRFEKPALHKTDETDMPNIDADAPKNVFDDDVEPTNAFAKLVAAETAQDINFHMSQNLKVSNEKPLHPLSLASHVNNEVEDNLAFNRKRSAKTYGSMSSKLAKLVRKRSSQPQSKVSCSDYNSITSWEDHHTVESRFGNGDMDFSGLNSPANIGVPSQGAVSIPTEGFFKRDSTRASLVQTQNTSVDFKNCQMTNIFLNPFCRRACVRKDHCCCKDSKGEKQFFIAKRTDCFEDIPNGSKTGFQRLPREESPLREFINKNDEFLNSNQKHSSIPTEMIDAQFDTNLRIPFHSYLGNVNNKHTASLDQDRGSTGSPFVLSQVSDCGTEGFEPYTFSPTVREPVRQPEINIDSPSGNCLSTAPTNMETADKDDTCPSQHSPGISQDSQVAKPAVAREDLEEPRTLCGQSSDSNLLNVFVCLKETGCIKAFKEPDVAVPADPLRSFVGLSASTNVNHGLSENNVELIESRMADCNSHGTKLQNPAGSEDEMQMRRTENCSKSVMQNLPGHENELMINTLTVYNSKMLLANSGCSENEKDHKSDLELRLLNSDDCEGKIKVNNLRADNGTKLQNLAVEDALKTQNLLDYADKNKSSRELKNEVKVLNLICDEGTTMQISESFQAAMKVQNSVDVPFHITSGSYISRQSFSELASATDDYENEEQKASSVDDTQVLSHTTDQNKINSLSDDSVASLFSVSTPERGTQENGADLLFCNKSQKSHDSCVVKDSEVRCLLDVSLNPHSQTGSDVKETCFEVPPHSDFYSLYQGFESEKVARKTHSHSSFLAKDKSKAQLSSSKSNVKLKRNPPCIVSSVSLVLNETRKKVPETFTTEAVFVSHPSIDLQHPPDKVTSFDISGNCSLECQVEEKLDSEMPITEGQRVQYPPCSSNQFKAIDKFSACEQSNQTDELDNDPIYYGDENNEQAKKLTILESETKCTSSEQPSKYDCDSKTIPKHAIADDVSPVMREGPEGKAGSCWMQVVDPETGKKMYVNSLNGNTVFEEFWKPPVDSNTVGNEGSKEKMFGSTVGITTAEDFQNLKSSAMKVTDPLVDECLSHTSCCPSREEEVPPTRTEEGISDEVDYVICDMWKAWQNPVFQQPDQDILCAGMFGSEPKTGAKLHWVVHPCQFTKSMLSQVKVLGQVDNKFIAIVAKTEESKTQDRDLLLLIDQHAAHERIRLEQLTADVYVSDSDNGMVVKHSQIIPPEALRLSAGEVRVVKSFKKEFLKIGLDVRVDDCCDSTVRVHTLPSCFLVREASELRHKRDSVVMDFVESLFKEQVEMLQITHGARTQLPKTIHNLLCSQACHGAIKFGDELSLHECEELIEELAKCQLPFQCAHGRPALIPLVDLNHLQKRLNPEVHKKPMLSRLKKKD